MILVIFHYRMSKKRWTFLLRQTVYLNSYLCRLSAIFASSLCHRPARFATTKKEFTTARRRSSASTAASPRILAPRSSCTCALILVTSPSPAMCVNIEVVITIHYVDISWDILVPNLISAPFVHTRLSSLAGSRSIWRRNILKSAILYISANSARTPRCRKICSRPMP